MAISGPAPAKPRFWTATSCRTWPSNKGLHPSIRLPPNCPLLEAEPPPLLLRGEGLPEEEAMLPADVGQKRFQPLIQVDLEVSKGHRFLAHYPMVCKKCDVDGGKMTIRSLNNL